MSTLWIESRKHDGSFRFRTEAELLHADDRTILALGYPNRTIARTSGDITRSDWSIEYLPLDRPYNIVSFFDLDGRLKYHFCNVLTGQALFENTLSYIDLDLDLRVHPDGEYIVEDEHEFEVNARAMSYSTEVMSLAREGLAELRELAETRGHLFGVSSLSEGLRMAFELYSGTGISAAPQRHIPLAQPNTKTKCVLLLISSRTYRADAFLQAAARLGLEVVQGLDMPDKLAEYWHVQLPLDFANLEVSERRLLEFARTHPLDAVLSVDDSATELAARASAGLGLPHNSPTSAVAARDKGVMREMLARGGVRVPGFQLHKLSEDPEGIASVTGYPSVLKPLRLSGSRGVMRVNSEEEFVAAFDRLKRLLVSNGDSPENTDFLVEDYLPGGEVALEGLLTNGSLDVLALFDKPDPLEGPFFEETIYVAPSRLPTDMLNRIAECTAKACAALGLRHGPIHAELRVNDDGPWLIEVAGRSIGGLCSTILEFGSGMCLEELILRHAVGWPVESLERERHAVGVMMIPIPSGGMLASVEGVEEAERVRGIEGVEITARRNQPLVPLPEGDSYLGFIFAKGGAPEEVETALRSAHSKLRFEIRSTLPLLRQ